MATKLNMECELAQLIQSEQTLETNDRIAELLKEGAIYDAILQDIVDLKRLDIARLLVNCRHKNIKLYNSLVYAYADGDTELVFFVTQSLLRPGKISSELYNYIVGAVEWNWSVSIVKLLLQHLAKYDSPLQQRLVCIYSCACRYNVDAVRWLLDYGCDVNEVIWGYTPLHIACEFNQAATVKLLLQRGADAYFRDPDDMLPIENAIVNCSRDCIVELIGSKSAVLYTAIRSSSDDIVIFLLQQGATLEVEDRIPPIYGALERPSPVVLKLLCDAYRCDVNATFDLVCITHDLKALIDGKQDVTALMFALSIQSKWTETLLHLGANVNAVDSDGGTALHHACRMEHFASVKLLLEYGADANFANKMWQRRRTFVSFLCSLDPLASGGDSKTKVFEIQELQREIVQFM